MSKSSQQTSRTQVLPSYRYQQLSNLLHERGALRLCEVMREFGVARATAQRDLDRLCQLDGVMRTHGGVVLAEAHDESPAIKLTERQQVSPEAKRYMAQLAVHLLRGSETIYLDAGTTNLAVAEALAHADWRPVWVVTNSWHIAEVISLAGIRHELLGGEVDARSLAVSGATALETMTRFRFDWSVISGDAITNEGSVRVSRPPEALLKRAAINASGKSMFIAHAEKFAGDAHVEVAPLHEFDCWVTDRATDAMRDLCKQDDGPTLIDHLA